MRIKLNQETFPVFPGNNWVDIFNIFYLEEEIKYGWDYFSSIRCYKKTESGHIPDPAKTAEAFPLLLNLLAEEASKLQNLDFGTNPDKIAQIKYVRTKYDLGLKEAKDLVETGGIPPALKVWELPIELNFDSNIQTNISGKVAYVEDKGVFPVSLLQQKHLQVILDWQPSLSKEEALADKFYLFNCGQIEGIAPKIVYSYRKHSSTITVDTNTFIPNDDKLIGIYSSLEEAKSHYCAFKLGVKLATQAMKKRMIELTENYNPVFY